MRTTRCAAQLSPDPSAEMTHQLSPTDPLGHLSLYASPVPRATAFVVGSEEALRALRAAIDEVLEGAETVSSFRTVALDGVDRRLAVVRRESADGLQPDYSDDAFKNSGGLPFSLPEVRAHFTGGRRPPIHKL